MYTIGLADTVLESTIAGSILVGGLSYPSDFRIAVAELLRYRVDHAASAGYMPSND
jgi:hypothetical protein